MREPIFYVEPMMRWSENEVEPGWCVDGALGRVSGYFEDYGEAWDFAEAMNVMAGRLTVTAHADIRAR